MTGRLRNNHYVDGKGNTVFGFSFTCEEIDYLDSRAESEARRARMEGEGGTGSEAAAPAAPAAPTANGRSRKAPKAAPGNDDVPF